MLPSIENGPAGLMAAWRASGGCTLEAAPAGARGDDGLTASPQTLFLPCNGDDGLTAARPAATPSCLFGDDGLAANRVTSPAGGCPPFADDGLLAGGTPTRPPECWGVALIEDDGLSASNASPTYPGFCWDRR